MNPWDIVGAIGLIVIALIYIVFVITVTPAFNYLTEWTREHDDKFILSIDWGDERAAMSVSTWNKRRYPWLIFIDAVTFSGGTMEDYIQRIRRYQSMYDNLTIVADYGGVAKSIVRELREVHRIPIVNAEKTDKIAQIQFMNRDLSLGNVKLFYASDPSRPACSEGTRTGRSTRGT